jgi:polyisoprenoid-binding protein YceI
MRVGFVALAAVLVSLSSAAWAGAETYEFDTVHTSPTFKVRHFFTKVTGRFDDFSGVVSWDAHDPTRSSVELTIQIASVNTGNDKRDGHLKSPDFFDAENHPTLTFGDLTIRGVTQSVVVDLDVLGFAEMPGMGTRGGFLASTTIDRQDYGVSWSRKLDNGGVVLADEVEIEFPIEVVKKTS